MSENPPTPASTPAAPIASTGEPQPKTGNGFGLASMIVGIVTVAGFAIPVLNIGAIFTGVVGIVLGIVGLVIKFRPRKAAIAGVILSGVGLILSIILVVVYAAALVGASQALQGATVEAADPSVSAPAEAANGDSFKDGVLTTSDLKIVITDHKIIPVGQPGNEYGDSPVIAFYYSTTNLTDKKTDPDTAFLFNITAYQDNNPNAENKLDVAALPDDKFLDSQDEDIKKGGTVDNAIAFDLTDSTTPVDLVAGDILGLKPIGKISYAIQ